MLAATLAFWKYESMKQPELTYPGGPWCGVVWVDLNSRTLGAKALTTTHMFHEVFTSTYMRYVPEPNSHQWLEHTF